MRTEHALASLHARGTRFVLCDGKRPIWPRWQDARVAYPVVRHHIAGGGDIGFIPWSLRLSALDVDVGDVAELVIEHPPLTVLPSRRAGGAHLPYPDSQPRPNGKWEAYGCSGEVRSARGFLRFWPGGVEKLADALDRYPDAPPSFPTDLFEAAGIHAPVVPERRHDPRLAPKRPELPDLATVLEGGRNCALFDHLRFWAYGQLPGPDIAEWTAHVDAEAIRLNSCFPVPLPAREARRTAYSVSTWVYCGGVHLDRRDRTLSYARFCERQRKRALANGKRRRLRTWKRDAEIVARVEGGESMRAVGRDLGMNVTTIRHIVRRDREPVQSLLQLPE